MPRPGPRPYECIRRVWHSDRHQPMRGLLIQEIFRIVCEIHSPATKKNKEWQEKLPVVVLKAEEIMYSKANSETEYIDMNTLLDRTTDAINTIIRLDETTETGEYLQPCIEAALHLGCTPRRASRSQRNIDPRCYLRQEPNSLNTMSQYHILMKSPGALLTKPIAQANPFSPKNFPFTFHNENLGSSKVNHAQKYSSYPLCYSFRVPSPISNVVRGSSKFSSHFKNKSVSVDNTTQEDMTFGGCDLSLRLGPFGDAGSPTRKRSKLADPKAALCCTSDINLPVSSFSGQWIKKDEFVNMNASSTTITTGKTAVPAQAIDDPRISWMVRASPT
ncbi:PREDICTED: uncharacterized protein LOC104803655 [Tarenaya hassleriana]|uniref:uncharacterized protein LOC104803655 n=1 Tax=Tarenaya hassleriana TaxID=28532 RepID=UPI00053C16C5|nr:PREDICTED: uncharacterized protein LOC104803655 [Tarenaya hassleriana]